MTAFLGITISAGLIGIGAAIQAKFIHANPVVGMILMAFGGLCLLGTIIEVLEDRQPELKPLPAKNRKRLGPSDPG